MERQCGLLQKLESKNYESTKEQWKDTSFMYFVFIGCTTPRGLPTIYHQRPYQLGTLGRLPLLKYLAWSCDHSSWDSRDRGRACGNRPYHGICRHLFKPCTSYLSRFLVVIRHYMLFSAATVYLYCTPHGLQPITCWRCCLDATVDAQEKLQS